MQSKNKLQIRQERKPFCRERTLPFWGSPGATNGVGLAANELYFAVLPMIHLGEEQGHTEQVLTLAPDRRWATEFFPDEVDTWIQAFTRRADEHLSGGHVAGYDFEKEHTPSGRVIVRVTQHVG